MLAPPSSFPVRSSPLLCCHPDAWPQLEELRKAASASKIGSWRHALSGLKAGAGTELLAAISAARCRVLGPPLNPSAETAAVASILFGTVRYDLLRHARDGGFATLGQRWGWSHDQVESATTAVRAIVGAHTPVGTECGCSIPIHLGPLEVFPHLNTLAHTLLAFGLEWDCVLPALAHVYQGRFDPSGSQFWCSSPDGSLVASAAVRPWSSFRIPAASEGDPDVMVILSSDTLVAILASQPLRVRPVASRQRSSSRFFPSYIRLPRDEAGDMVYPTYRVTSLIEKREAWSRIIGNVDGVTWAILNGRLVYPRVSWMLTGSWLRNHPSYEDPEVKEVLGTKIATYLAQGALEWVPPSCAPPLYVEPTGAVFKPGPDRYRMISDARHGNKGLEHWGVRYHTALDFAAALDYSFFSFVDDVKDGYHLACLQGCTASLVWDYGITGFERDPDGGQRPTWGMRLHVGCSPASCTRVCDKSANGVASDGCIMRWAVAHFGQATAGSPLNCLALCLLRHMARRSFARFEAAKRACAPQVMSLEDLRTSGTQGVVWVDDFAFCSPVPYHRPCVGMAQGCITCLAALPEARASRRYWHSLCRALGVPLHDGKSQDCGQQPEFAGFMHDTVRGLRLILPKKLEKLLDSILCLGCADSASGRTVDQVLGRASHYSACIKHLRISCASLTAALGTNGVTGFDKRKHYDLEIQIDEPMRQLCQHMTSVVLQYSEAGKELWPTPPSTLLARFMAGTVTDAVASLTWDAAVAGWAALARWWERTADRMMLREQLLIGTWPDDADVEEQAHRETWAGALSLEALARVTDLHSFAILMRNDACSAISALSKGSFSSKPLQRVALRADKFCAKLDIDLYCMHVPGLALIEEGIDGASRSGHGFGAGMNVDSVRSAEVSDALWHQIQRVADRLQWKLTVDLFASASNHRTDRWVSWLPEPDAESFDAFLVPSWYDSMCPMCLRRHQEAVYVFPPPTLLAKVVAKAVADGAVGVFVTPVVVTSPVWHKLRSASVLPGPDGYVRVRRARRLLSGSFPHDDLAIFACDFGRLRGTANGWVDPGCAGAFRRRVRPVCGSAADADDRRRLRSAIPHAVR